MIGENMKNKEFYKSRMAFTLLELLCVIAIIALLMAILIPTLSKSRLRATKVICGSYLRQFVMIGQAYLDDNGDFFPEDPNEWLYSKNSFNSKHPIGCRWHDIALSPSGKTMTNTTEYQGKMWSYFENMQIRPCPTFRRYAASRGCENPSLTSMLDYRMSQRRFEHLWK
jgi:prepilin-type N-terminal cleavage/methylation domain-containing protein